MGDAGIVLITCEYAPFPGGIASYATQLVQAVKVSGFGAQVVAPEYPEFPQPTLDPDVARVLDHHGIPATAIPKVLRALRRAPRHWSLLAADIRSVLLTYILQPLHRRPYRVMMHGSEVAKLGSHNPLLRLARRAYRGAELVIANSQATLDIYAAEMGAHPRSVVSYLGVSPSWFESPQDDTFENRTLQALVPKSIVICTVGRIEARKGHLEVVRALARVRDEHGVPDPVYVIAGRPEDQTYCAAVLSEGQRQRIRIVQPGVLSESDIKRLYRRAACHVLAARALPGRIEGFGLVVIEAGAQGCPTVATRIGGIPEALGNGGRMVTEGAMEELARAIATYACDARRRELDGAAARSNAARFSWDAAARLTFPELDWPESGRRPQQVLV